MLKVDFRTLKIINIYFPLRKTTLGFVYSCYTFIRYLELSLLKNLFIYLFNFRNFWNLLEPEQNMSLYPIFPKLSTVQVLISSATVTQSVKKSSTAGTQALSIFAMPTNMYTTYRLSRSWSGQSRTYYRNCRSKIKDITM